MTRSMAAGIAAGAIIFLLAGGTVSAQLRQDFRMAGPEAQNSIFLRQLPKRVVIYDNITEEQIDRYYEVDSIGLMVRPTGFFPARSSIQRLAGYPGLNLVLALRPDFTQTHVEIFRMLKAYGTEITLDEQRPLDQDTINRMRSLGPVEKTINLSPAFYLSQDVKLFKVLNGYRFNFIVREPADLTPAFLGRAAKLVQKRFTCIGSDVAGVAARLARAGKAVYRFSFDRAVVDAAMIKKLNQLKGLHFEVVIREPFDPADASVLAGLSRLNAVVVETDGNRLSPDLFTMLTPGF